MGKGKVFFVNNFTDLNYLAPLVLKAGSLGERWRVVFYWEDLKRPSKVLFRQRSEEILNFGFWEKHNVEVLPDMEALEAFFKSFNGQLVVTSPTLAYLKNRHRLIKRRWWGEQLGLVAMDYLGENTGEIIDNVDLVFLSSQVWNNEFADEKVRYGLPYWDMFLGSNMIEYEFEKLQQGMREPLRIEANRRYKLIPQIVQDGAKWFEDCWKYLEERSESDVHYFVKYRPKTLEDVKENKDMEERINELSEVTAIYSPYFFTLSLLLHNCESVVFTSNASFIIFDCMAANVQVEMVFKESRSGIWQDWLDRKTYVAVDEYVKNGEMAKNKFIVNQGRSSDLFFEELETLYEHERV